ncbi:hypothetical protein F5X68DRAFT_237948 [Plectosphaerella plurivora]|uniref:ABM domain-containing protein n=1 Tax=Plectosphaerella plurivora TaxID=936078 RepID=A0A9P9A4E8_9PEZI|nr:hypothetical protein F5X68DRAFT_237948 [Plectosphaerella plurivora]
MRSAIHQSVLVRTKPDKLADMKKLIVDLAKHVQETEPGMLQYEYFEGEDSEGHIIIIQETYGNQAAFDFHHESEYYRTASKIFVEWLAAPVEILRLTPIAGFGSR